MALDKPNGDEEIFSDDIITVVTDESTKELIKSYGGLKIDLVRSPFYSEEIFKARLIRRLENC